MTVVTFGSLLRRRRVAAGLSQDALAAAAGVSAKAVSELERDPDRRPRLQTVTLLADALELDAAGRAQLLAVARPEPAAGNDDTVPGGRLSSPLALRGGLPAPTSRLVGRAGELETLVGLLTDPDVRLVTVTGTGGVGKTRLAIEVAAAVTEVFVDGVFMVDLAAVDDPAYVTSALLQAVDLPASGEQGLHDLVRWLDSRKVLLLLDNFEHVIEGAPTVAMLLERARGLTCLATSRVRLHLSAEWEYPLAPLLAPDPHTDAATTTAESPAVELLADRAVAGGAPLEVTAESAALADICRRPDGIPLAIELAATRLKSMPTTVLLERLADPLGVLTGGYRDLPDRQRTLRDTLAWSHSLLTVEARQLFAALSVFTGEFSLVAAETVCRHDCPDGAEVVGLLAGLADHSLLVPVGDDGEARFRMLHVVREYAHEQLHAGGRTESVRRRHAEFYLGCVTELEPVLLGPDEGVHLSRFDRDFSNVRVALTWALDHPAEVDLAALADILCRYWAAKLKLACEGLQWLQTALNVTRSDTARAKLLTLMSRMAWMADHPSGRNLVDRTLILCQQVDDVDGTCQALSLKAGGAWLDGDHTTARQLIEEALKLSRHSSSIRVRCYVLHQGIEIAEALGDDVKAAALIDEYVAVADQPGGSHYYRGWGQLLRARAALIAGDPDACLALLPDLDALDWDERQHIETLTLRGAAHLQRRQPQEATPFLLEAFRLSSDNRLILEVPTTLHGLAAVAALCSNIGVAATLAALVTVIAGDDRPVTTRVEHEVFLPAIADVTEDLTATEWHDLTSTAQKLFDGGTVQGVTELILSPSPKQPQQHG